MNAIINRAAALGAAALGNPYLNVKASDGPPCPYKHGTAQAVLWRQMQDAISSKSYAEAMIVDYEATKHAAEITIAAMERAIGKLEGEPKD